VPRLGLTLLPPASANLAPLKDWAAVSAWLTNLEQPATQLTPALRAKSAELTANLTAERDKIFALARFAQQVNYVSVQTNITRGGGYVPHAASEVLTRNYGDCKDKSALLKALLAAAGIDSYMMSIYSGERTYVRDAWPSPNQFNHAIVAIRVSPSFSSPLVLDHPSLGRLFFFDPTDTATPPGSLDDDLQGSLALVDAGPQGALIRLPLLPPAENRVEHLATAVLDPTGAASASVSSSYHGASAAYWRYFLAHNDAAELRKSFERTFARLLGATALDSIRPDDQPAAHRITLLSELKIPVFGQLMQNRLLVFKPGALCPPPGFALPAQERRLPIHLTARLRSGRASITLPAGFAVDELPDPVQLSAPFGSFSARWAAKDGKLEFEQTLDLKDADLPASEYPAVRRFFEQVSTQGQAAAVLIRR